MAPENMHNVEGFLAVAPSRRGMSRGNCCLASLLVNIFFFFSHKLTPSLLVKFDVNGVFVHEMVLRVVPVAQPPSVQLEVSQENMCDTDLASAFMARSSDIDILQDFPVCYDGVFILWVVAGGLLLAALLVAALFWVCGSAPSPMPTSGVVCRRLNLLYFQYLALFAAMLGLLRWFLAYSGKRIISQGQTESSGNGRDLEGKNDWNAPHNLCFSAPCPVQVTSYAFSGFLAAALAFVGLKFVAVAMAAAEAAAFRYFFMVTTACGFTSGVLFSLVESLTMSAAAFSSSCKKITSAATAAAFAAAFGFLSMETTACGFTLGACFFLTLFGILVFIICNVAGFCWIVASFSWSHLANGLVLGLLVLCTCTTALVVHASDLLGLQSFEYALDGFLALESDGMDRQVLAGSLFLGTGEQASGRVDVPGKDIQQQAAAASMGSGLCLEATKGVQICQSCQESSAPPVTPVCSILVRTLSGRTRVCSLPAGFTVDDLENCVSEYTAVPRSSFFLTYQGKMLAADQVKNIDSGSLIPVVMHGRLRGGSAIPGAWVCNVCHASGCWPTKNRCFRCGHARDTRLASGAPVFSPPAGREAAHPGRAPRAKAAPVNPTFRPPRVIPPKKSSSPANASSPPVSPQTQVSPELLVATLRALGIGDDLLTQIQSSILPPAPKVERKEQKLFQLRGLIETKKAQVAKLDRSVTHHRSQMEVCLTNKQRREEELAALQAGVSVSHRWQTLAELYSCCFGSFFKGACGIM